ncbi:MAG: NAD(P)-dependent oxidoreductase [Dehalococcoidia bacterium]
MSEVTYLAAEADPAVDQFLKQAADRFETDVVSPGSGVLDVLPGNPTAVVLGPGVSLALLNPGSCQAVQLVQLTRCTPGAADVEAFSEHGIAVAGVSPALAPIVAERTLNLVHAALGLPTVEPGGSQSANQRLAGKTVGIIGLGRVGEQVARKLGNTGARTIYCDVRTAPQGLAVELGLRRSTLDLLLTKSDVVTVHVPWGPTTSPLIGPRELSLLQPDAVLINMSHNRVVDEEALLDCLSSRSIRAAGLETTADEPAREDSRLLALDNVVTTPGADQDDAGAILAAASFAADNVWRVLNGQEPGGLMDVIDFPRAGDPAFWSSKMSPRTR